MKPAPSAPPVRTGTLIALAILAAVWWLSGSVIEKANQAKSPDWDTAHLTYLPSGKFMKPFVLGMDEAVASMFWTNSVLYFAESFMEGKNDTWLGHMFTVIADLNPEFTPVYEFGPLTLTKAGKGEGHQTNLKTAIMLLERGIKKTPGNWKLYVYASMTQIQLDSNYSKAAAFMEPATRIPGAPAYLQSMAVPPDTSGLQKGRNRTAHFLINEVFTRESMLGANVMIWKLVQLFPQRTAQDNFSRELLERMLMDGRNYPRIRPIAGRVIVEYLEDRITPKTAQFLSKYRKKR